MKHRDLRTWHLQDDNAASVIWLTRFNAGPMVLSVLILFLCAGCGNRKCPISGEVTFDGQPVETGTITLEPADGQGPTTGGEIRDGKYALLGKAAPLPGKKMVRISASRKTGRRIPAGPPATPDVIIEEVVRYIPETYNKRTTLSCDISADGSPQINFDLKSQQN